MPSSLRSTNQLLRSLPAAEFEALRPHLGFVELVREAVLVEAGAPLTHIYLPQSGILSMAVRLSEGQSVEVALVGRDSVFGPSAAFDGAISLTDAVVLLPGTAFSTPRIFERRPIGALPFEPFSHDMNRAWSHRPNNLRLAMRLIRSKLGCLAGCCGHAT